MSTSTEASIAIQPSQPQQPDWFLQSLVNMVNASSFEFGVTLQVSGMLVSGYLVGGQKYFSGFASDFLAGIDNFEEETKQTIQSNFEAYGNVYKTPEEGQEVPPPQMIHLRDARFYNTAGNAIPANRGVWWRGRLSEVGGFILGNLSQNK
jgi:hypothetical protein